MHEDIKAYDAPKALKFKNPVFDEGVWNLTVRLGVRKFEVDEIIDLVTVQDDGRGRKVILGVGRAVVRWCMVVKFGSIPNDLLKYEHDPACRTRIGLQGVMESIYGTEFDWNKLVTLICFVPELPEPDKASVAVASTNSNGDLMEELIAPFRPAVIIDDPIKPIINAAKLEAFSWRSDVVGPICFSPGPHFQRMQVEIDELKSKNEKAAKIIGAWRGVERAQAATISQLCAERNDLARSVRSHMDALKDKDATIHDLRSNLASSVPRKEYDADIEELGKIIDWHRGNETLLASKFDEASRSVAMLQKEIERLRADAKKLQPIWWVSPPFVPVDGQWHPLNCGWR
jgi:hypothetical protein